MDKSSNILVTGGTGFLGSYILRYLVKKGYTNLHSLKRENSRTELIEDIQNKIHFHKADILDIPTLENAIQEVDFVIHTAAVVSFKSRDRDLLMKVNIEGTANIVNLCIDNNIKKLIHVSSIAALGRTESGVVKSEKTEWQDGDINSDYSISKYFSEMEVWRGYSEGLPVAIINPSMILGAGFWDVGTGELFKKVNSGLPVYPTGTNGFVDVRDVALMTILLLEKDIIGERFICSAENVKLQSVFTNIAKNLNKKPPAFKLSSSLVSIASFFLDLLNLIPGYSSNLSSQSLKNASFDSIYDNQKSITELGFQYRSIDESISETAELFKQTYQKGINFTVFEV